MSQPYIASTIYAPEDSEMHSEFLRHLSPLQRSGWLKILSDNDILPGSLSLDESFKMIKQSSLVFVLLSSDFYNPANLLQLDPMVKCAMQKELPFIYLILLKPLAYNMDPMWKDIPIMPRNGKEVIHSSWDTREYAWKDIAQSIAKVIYKFENERLARMEVSNEINSLRETRFLMMGSYINNNRIKLWFNQFKKFFTNHQSINI